VALNYFTFLSDLSRSLKPVANRRRGPQNGGMSTSTVEFVVVYMAALGAAAWLLSLFVGKLVARRAHSHSNDRTDQDSIADR
jgi:hypothetical protein